MGTCCRYVIALCGFVLTGIAAIAQDMADNCNYTSAGKERREYFTQPIGDDEIKLDGVPDEAEWLRVNWESYFTQNQPDDGGKPYQQTAFKILFDHKFLYLAYRAYDTSPDS